MRLKKKNFVIALTIILIIFIEVFNPFKIASSYALKKMNYSSSSAEKIVEYDLKEKVLEDEYSEFINQKITDKEFLVSNYDIYKKLDYHDDLNDLSIVNELINKGYNVEEINCILNTGDINSINGLLEKEKIENIVNFLSFDYANLSNLERYIEYQRKTISDYDETVLYVEIGLDNDFYTNYEVINKFSFDMLVNKYNQLSKDFIPSDLVQVNSNYSVNDDNYGNSIMLDNFYKMADDLNKELGLKIYIRSAYRTYESQEEVYQQYLDLYGKNYVKKYVAYPGFSEHQTGLSIDIKASSSNTYANTDESKWVKENAYKYGFIERYTKKLEDITGYQSELWHYRYVGVEIATYIHENKISFDEYYIKFIKNK